MTFFEFKFTFFISNKIRKSLEIDLYLIYIEFFQLKRNLLPFEL